MNERELLEMAAKAAGYEITGFAVGRNKKEWAVLSCGTRWNPLQDDGDALRLAVAVGVNPIQCTDSVDAMHFDSCIVATEMFTDHGNDKVAATRLAITRAAAQIGKAMP